MGATIQSETGRPARPVVTSEGMAGDTHMGSVPCQDCGAKVVMAFEVLAMFPRQQCEACEARARGEIVSKAAPAAPVSDAQWRLDRWEKGEPAKDIEPLCPPCFRDTTEDRLREVWGMHLDKVLGWSPKSSKGLLLGGASGAGKTRAMFLLFRRLWLDGHEVRVVFPDELHDLALKSSRDGERAPTIRRLCRPLALGLDDALLTGAADERIQSFLKDLSDARYRQCKPLFITSQVSRVEYVKEADKFANLGAAGMKRLEGLMRRFNATMTVVRPFIDREAASAQAGETAER